MKALRILFVSSAPEMSGTYFRAFFLSKYLVKAGHEVLLIASSRKATLHTAKKLVDGVDVFLLPRVRKENRLLKSLSMISTSFIQILLNHILEVKFDFDILHSFDVMGPQNATLTLMSKILHSLRIHDRKIFVDWDERWGRGGLLSQYGGVYLLMLPLLEFLEEKVPLFAHAVTVCSETLRQHALWMGVKHENLFVIPNGANIDFIRPLNIYTAKQRLNLPVENIIYTQAGIMDMESLKLLVTAHKKVVARCPNTTLLLIGLHKYQIDFVESLAMIRNVVCVERQPYYKYPLYLGASDILLLPLQDNLYNCSRCGVPARLGDYLAAGRPIVATDLGEMENIVSECGFRAKPGDPEDFANKLLEVIRDPDLREKMGKRARELAETRFSWQILAKKLEEIYDRYL